MSNFLNIWLLIAETTCSCYFQTALSAILILTVLPILIIFKSVEITRLRYTCPRCERSLRPELSTVIPILEELIPLVAPGKTPPPSAPIDASNSITPAASIVTSDLVASLLQVAFLLRLPSMAAVQMLCERAFAFVRRVRSVILASLLSNSLHRLCVLRVTYAQISVFLFSL